MDSASVSPFALVSVRIITGFGLSFPSALFSVRIIHGFGLSFTLCPGFSPNHARFRTQFLPLPCSQSESCSVSDSVLPSALVSVRIIPGFGLSFSLYPVLSPNHARFRTEFLPLPGSQSESYTVSDSVSPSTLFSVRIMLGFGLSFSLYLGFSPNHARFRTQFLPLACFQSESATVFL
ncbi:hypothetical protein J2Z37_004414 [Ammoniphilus resinae]|uniref:Uncharacterized protein n=1 Tax=Ammoniphilus resinae TaxID=861532 RepID=A0ABS4GVV4_9BACL|nr:hypothetical protein [Ammoniphilus resinae]